MRVRNINGTSDNPKCPCGRWIKHWENYSGKYATICSESECYKDAKHGSHVQKVDSDDRSWYIIPLCEIHNGYHGQEIEVSNSTILIPVTNRDKCKS